MVFFLVFLSGIVNFASQKAVMESGHPFIESVREHFGKVAGERLGMFLDFVILAGTLLVAFKGNVVMPMLYFGYTLFNIIAAWLIINRRI